METSGKVKINDVYIPYKVKINKRLKNMRLSFKEGELILYTPLIHSKINFSEIFSRHAKWIYTNYKKTGDNKLKEWIEGDLILYRGNLYPLHLIQGDSKSKVEFTEDRFILHTGFGKIREERQEIFRRFYIEKAREAIIEAINKYKLILQVKEGTLRIKEQKTCWGSCSKKSNLNFNWKLILAPPELLEYVVVHELCHLRELNHSNNFWKLVQEVFPNYKASKCALKLYESKINNWDKV